MTPRDRIPAPEIAGAQGIVEALRTVLDKPPSDTEPDAAYGPASSLVDTLADKLDAIAAITEKPGDARQRIDRADAPKALAKEPSTPRDDNPSNMDPNSLYWRLVQLHGLIRSLDFIWIQGDNRQDTGEIGALIDTLEEQIEALKQDAEKTPVIADNPPAADDDGGADKATDLEIPDTLTVETLPDDARDCCRMIHRLYEGPSHEFPHNSAPVALCHLAELIRRFNAAKDTDDDDIAHLATKPLEVLAILAEPVIHDWQKQLSDTHDIARHGTGDLRAFDRECLERQREAAQ